MSLLQGFYAEVMVIYLNFSNTCIFKNSVNSKRECSVTAESMLTMLQTISLWMRFPECCPNLVLLKSVGALPPTSVKSVLDTCSAGLQKMYSHYTLQLMLLWHFGTRDCYPGSSMASC